MAAIAARRLASVSADDIPVLTASFTRAVTSSMRWSASNSRSGARSSRAVRREKPVGHEIAARRAELLQHGHGYVVVRQDQAIRRHERSGAAREADRSLLHARQPGVGELDAKRLFDGRPRHMVEGPEPFIRLTGDR
jgi:hypothetical protein